MRFFRRLFHKKEKKKKEKESMMEEPEIGPEIKVSELTRENKWRRLDPTKLMPYVNFFGEMGQACYDAFSRKDGRFKFSKEDLFDKVGLQSHSTNYKITEFISTNVCLLDKIRWTSSTYDSAFVCVSTNESAAVRDIVISWRGTVKTKEWRHNLQWNTVKANHVIKGDKSLRIHSGWLSAYMGHRRGHKSARDQVIDEVNRLVKYYKGEEIRISITGHSLGAALAVISAADIVTNRINLEYEVTVFTFAQPRVGNKTFCRTLAEAPKLRILRVVDKHDIVPHLPIGLFKYHHSDDLVLKTNANKSTSVKHAYLPTIAHKLETYLHSLREAISRSVNKTMKKSKNVLKKRFHAKKKRRHGKLYTKFDGEYSD